MQSRLVIAMVWMCAACATSPAGETAGTPEPNLIDTSTMRVDAEGRCFARIPTGAPQLVTEVQAVEVAPAQVAADGTILSPPVFRNEEITREVSSAPMAEFEMVCPPALTPEFTGNLQRALAARGFYAGPINRQLDAATQLAIRLLQRTDPVEPINSPILSRRTAQDLGLVPLSADQIDALELP